MLCAALCAVCCAVCRYKGGYWEAREAGGQFTGCRDIFGPGVAKGEGGEA